MLIIFFLSSFSLAGVEIAFIEIRAGDGRVLQLEPNGRFAHIAISYQGNWLHTHPYRGVELVSRKVLEETGLIIQVIRMPEVELESTAVKSVLGKPYDSTFSWNSDGFYCSELVGKLLKLHPEPMLFARPLWKGPLTEKAGEFGLSPDDIYRILQGRGYRVRTPVQACAKLFM